MSQRPRFPRVLVFVAIVVLCVGSIAGWMWYSAGTVTIERDVLLIGSEAGPFVKVKTLRWRTTRDGEQFVALKDWQLTLPPEINGRDLVYILYCDASNDAEPQPGEVVERFEFTGGGANGAHGSKTGVECDRRQPYFFRLEFEAPAGSIDGFGLHYVGQAKLLPGALPGEFAAVAAASQPAESQAAP